MMDGALFKFRQKGHQTTYTSTGMTWAQFGDNWSVEVDTDAKTVSVLIAEFDDFANIDGAISLTIDAWTEIREVVDAAFEYVAALSD